MATERKRKKQQVNSESKGVYFNLDKPMDKELYDYVTSDQIVNYSSFMKGLIYDHIQRTGGVIAHPYQQAVDQTMAPPVKVAVPRTEVPAPRRLQPEVQAPVEDEPDYDEPEIDDEISAEVEEDGEDDSVEEAGVSTRSNALANFGAVSARDRRRNK